MTCKRSTVPTLLVHPALKSVLKGLMAANNGGSPISVLGVGTPRGHNLTNSNSVTVTVAARMVDFYVGY